MLTRGLPHLTHQDVPTRNHTRVLFWAQAWSEMQTLLISDLVQQNLFLQQFLMFASFMSLSDIRGNVIS